MSATDSSAALPERAAKSTKPAKKGLVEEVHSMQVMAAATTSKLIPASAPAVSPWGVPSSSSNAAASPAVGKESSTTRATLKNNWPTPEVALKETTNTVTKPKVPAPAPKVKSTGKEKWVKYSADISIATNPNGNTKNEKNNNAGNGNANQKKKNNNNGNGYGSGTGNQQKKRQNNNGNRNQSGQKNIKKEQKKQGENNNSKRSSDKKEKYPVDSMTELSIESATVVEALSASPTSAAVESFTAPVQAEGVLVSSTDNSFTSEFSEAVTSTVDLKPSELQAVKSRTTSPKPSGDGNEIAAKNSGFDSHKKQHFHRQSEPFIPYNLNQMNADNNSRQRRYNHDDTHNKNYKNRPFNNRNSFAGFNGGPMMNQGFNNYYIPAMVPPANSFNFNAQFIPPPQFNAQLPAQPITRSETQSPNRGEFVHLNHGMGIPPMGGVMASPVDGGMVPQFIPPPLFNPYHAMADPITSQILHTMSYYFSDENLVKDLFLKQNMNSEGYVPITLITGFKKIRELTGGDLNIFMRSLEGFPEIEVNNGKIRRSYDWKKWVLPYKSRLPTGQVEETQDVTSLTKENQEVTET